MPAIPLPAEDLPVEWAAHEAVLRRILDRLRSTETSDGPGARPAENANPCSAPIDRLR
ncbi:hypothetical protein ABTY61_34680 [Kitasatospora sp. NPDC096128]|uniref:hypothetical protein n=1 Tax=Kitasatospora sp. NPDC096128 TaxID=3155547 RepID=UPI003318E780